MIWTLLWIYLAATLFLDEKTKLVSQVERAKTQIEQFTEDIKIAEADWLQAKENVEAVKRDVNRYAEEMIRVIREEQRRLITEAENTKKAEQNRLTANKEKIRNQKKKIESAMKQAEDLLQRRGTGTDIAHSRKQFEANRLQQLLSNKPEIQVKGYKKVVFMENPLPNKNLTHGGIGRVGTTDTDRAQSTAEGDGLAETIAGLEAQLMVTTKNSKGDVCYSSLDRVAVEITRRGGQEPVKNVQIEDKKNGSYHVRYLVADPGECDVRVTVNGEDVRRPPIRVKPRELKTLTSFGSKGTGPGQFNYPWGVAVNMHGEIAVSDARNHRVQVFSTEGSLLFSLGGKGTGDGQFTFPHGVTYNSDDNLLVADSLNHRIQQFSRTGQFMRTFGAKGELGGKLNRPQGISTSPDGNIIVADIDNKRVVEFTPEGRVLLTLHGADQLSPSHCVSHGNRYFVSDLDGNCIKVFSDQGDFLYQFGREGTGDGEFREPVGLAVDKSGRLIVCDRENHRIQLFQLDGTFCCEFGGKPSFNRPACVVVLSDGRFALTQNGGHDVQLLMWGYWTCCFLISPTTKNASPSFVYFFKTRLFHDVKFGW